MCTELDAQTLALIIEAVTPESFAVDMIKAAIDSPEQLLKLVALNSPFFQNIFDELEDDEKVKLFTRLSEGGNGELYECWQMLTPQQQTASAPLCEDAVLIKLHANVNQ